MRTAWTSCALISLLWLVPAVPQAFAKDDPMTDDDVVIKNDDGSARLLLPKDWPVEHAHGIISPVPTEQYLSMKFGQVRDRFQQTDAQLDALEQRLATLEQEHKALQLQVRLFEERQNKEVPHGHETQTPQAP